VSRRPDPTDGIDAAQALIEELLRVAFALQEVIGSLLEDLPEDAFPGEESADVLLEMFAGTCLPVVEAAGPARCREATALIGAVRDRILNDLRAAAELAREDE
jgi:hypothetical protein